MSRRRFTSRWGDDADPMASMATLVDVMLVFACGLMAAAVASGASTHAEETGADARPPTMSAESILEGRPVERGREMAEPPSAGEAASGGGPVPVGRVFRDPETGRLILVDDGPADRGGGRR